ncbi:MAG TPA: hypothetical protein VH186_34690 [Chloroflexia bacterium]|nr:hypothetical protein [Chloroflexia bacterium]
MKTIKLFSGLLLLLTLALILAACGESNTIDLTSNTVSAGSATATTGAPATTGVATTRSATTAAVTPDAPATVTPVTTEATTVAATTAAPTATVAETTAPPVTATPKPTTVSQAVSLRNANWPDVLANNPQLTVEQDYSTEEGPYVNVKDPALSGVALLKNIIYYDLDKDGAAEAIIILNSGGTAGNVGFLVYTRATPRPKLVGAVSGYKMEVDIKQDQLLGINALYSAGIPNCCPNAAEFIYYTLSGGKLKVTSSHVEAEASYMEQKVSEFYKLLGSKQLDKAYKLLSARYQKANPFDKWSKGYASTKDIQVKAEATGSPNLVQVEINATDNTASGPKTRKFVGTWRVKWDEGTQDFFLDEADIQVQKVQAPSVKVNPVFNPILQDLIDFAGVPVLLPNTIPGNENNQPLYASIARANGKGYWVDISFTPDCNGATACDLGYVSGDENGPGVLPLKGDQYKLAQGLTGYYVAGHCGSSCDLSTLTWKIGDVHYTVAIGGSGPDLLVEMANSAINNGSIYQGSK